MTVSEEKVLKTTLGDKETEIIDKCVGVLEEIVSQIRYNHCNTVVTTSTCDETIEITDDDIDEMIESLYAIVNMKVIY